MSWCRLGLALLALVGQARVHSFFVLDGRGATKVNFVGRGVRLSAAPTVELAGHQVTPKLGEIIQGLRELPTDAFRYKQVLYLAQQARGLPSELKVAENKVPGCLSTVHVVARLEEDRIFFEGDSDAQLTKGLVTLLVDGLSGYTADEIQAVSPEFIKLAGLGASLTPGRNNGFMNMLAVMKRKAADLGGLEPVDSSPAAVSDGQSSDQSRPASAVDESGSEALREAVELKLKVLKPEKVDVSVSGDPEATTLCVVVEAACFQGMDKDKRQQLVRTVLRDELSRVQRVDIEV